MIYKMLLRIMLMGLAKVGICVIMSVNQNITVFWTNIMEVYYGADFN